MHRSSRPSAAPDGLRAAQRERALYRAVLESSLDGVMAFRSLRGQEGQIVDFVWELINPRAEAIVGRTAAELVGKRLLEEMPGNRESGLFDAYVQVVETGEPFERTFYYPHEGLDRWFWTTAVQVDDGFAVTFRDVTGQRQAEAALQRSERFLARAQEIAHLGSWEWNATTGGLTWSDQLYRIYGLEPGEPVSFERYLTLVHPDDRARVEHTVRGVLAAPGPFSFHERIVRPDGTVRELDSVGEAELDEEGGLHLLGVCHDVTEQRQAEAERRRSEARFRLLAEHTSDLVTLHTPEGVVLYASPSVERMLGYTPDEIVGRNPYELMHPDDQAAVRRGAHASVLEGTEHVQSLARLRHKDGPYVWLETTSRPILDDDGRLLHIQSSARDVTERVQAEQQLELTNRALEQRNRELQDFAYVASHDLQEPLRKIRAFSDLLREDYGARLDDEGKHYLQRMQEAATRMASLINDLLSYSRVSTQPGNYQPLDLNRIVGEVLSDLEVRRAETQGVVHVADLPAIEADATQMRQLFQNLIGNALKFHREGVPPVVEVRAEPAEEPGFFLFSVADNGVGFDEKYANRIFSPFQRLHNRSAYEGTGMGLAICRRIVERHGGTIRAQSRPGAGTTFYFTLAAQPPASNTAPPASAL